MHLLKELLEASLSKERKVRDTLVDANKDIMKAAPKKDRIYANMSAEDFIGKIKAIYPNVDNVEVIKKGEPGSKSSMFDTFSFNVDGVDVSLVLAKGVVAGAAGEEAEVAAVQKILDEVGPITIEVAGETYNNVTKIERVAGNKKADFVMTSSDGPIYIQHKSPTHQQMSGIRNLLRSSEYGDEIKEFVNSVKDKVESEGGRLSGRMSAPIKNEDLKRVAVYGTTDSEFSKDAVQVYCIGNISLVKSGGVYKLKGSKATYEYPEIPAGEDEPMLGATYRKGRKQEGIQDIRLGIYPRGYLTKKSDEESTDSTQ